MSRNWFCQVCGTALAVEDVFTISHGRVRTLNMATLCEPCCDAALASEKADVAVEDLYALDPREAFPGGGDE